MSMSVIRKVATRKVNASKGRRPKDGDDGICLAESTRNK